MYKLKVDYTIDKIIKEIIEEVEREQGFKLDEKAVIKVIEQQLDSTVKGLFKGYKVVWKFFGTFIATKKRIDSLNKEYEKRGYPKTLQDFGVTRMSFTRQGEKVAEAEITPHRKSDLIIYPDIAKPQYGNI